MKKFIVPIIAITLLFNFSTNGKTKQKIAVKDLQPKDITNFKVNDQVIAEFCSLSNMNNLTEKQEKRYSSIIDKNDPIIYDHFIEGCSWYCGGNVENVKASSCLKPQGKNTYKASNAHDFKLDKVWAEGVKGNGIGEWLEYSFKGECPRVTDVYILNGYVKSKKAWTENSRVKTLKMYYMGKPYAILHLKDTRGLQHFEVGVLGFNNAKSPDWTLRFEILEVYPGTKYSDTVISELYFDGIDVH